LPINWNATLKGCLKCKWIREVEEKKLFRESHCGSSLKVK